MINDNRFRSDLYFRLGVIRVEVPSLNERSEGILPLAKYFLLAFNKKFNKNLSGLSSQTEKLLGINHHTYRYRRRKLAEWSSR